MVKSPREVHRTHGDTKDSNDHHAVQAECAQASDGQDDTEQRTEDGVELKAGPARCLDNGGMT